LHHPLLPKRLRHASRVLGFLRTDAVCRSPHPFRVVPQAPAVNAFRHRIAAAHRAQALRLAAGLAVVVCIVVSGCQQLRLPAVDPSGQCLLAPYPTSTTLALPCSGGEGCACLSCARGLAAHLHDHKANLHAKLQNFHRGATTPAFPEPADPPPCLETTGPTQLPPCGRDLSDLGACGDECNHGPPAVLYGDEVLGKRRHHHHHGLPSRGTRGRILLSPQKIVAPVGGEVILLSGICGNDGYLQVGEPLEWMLTPESVGTFIEVGNDDPGMLHRLAKLDKADKRSGSYALGVTSTKRSLITRGNLNSDDDVPLDKGQTWLSISSPTEGTSRVTVLAPQSDCWDQRKATATIYWVDARWQFPGPRRELAGTPVTLSTRVTRAEGTIPARGWTVRYEILNPELALFAGSGSAVFDARVDDAGNATAELLPVQTYAGTFASGTAAIAMHVIRPGGERDNMPDLTLGSGQTFVTWSAPQLSLRAGAPAIATYGTPVEVFANVQNPGDQPAHNVRVSVAIPPGTRVTQADSFAEVTPNQVHWEIGTIPPRIQLDLFMTITAQSSVRLNFQARGDSGLYAEDTVAVDVFRPSLAINVRAAGGEPVEVGTPITFNIDVTNTGERPLTGVNLRAVGDSGLTHTETGSRIVGQNKTDGPLQPGATWNAAVTFLPVDSGRRCITVEAFADAGQQAEGQACTTVINRVLAVPALTATITGPERMTTGTDNLFRYRVVNTGQVPLSSVRITATFDPQLQLIRATEGYNSAPLGQYQISWLIPFMPVGPDERSAVLVEARFLAQHTSPQSQMILTVESAEGARASDSYAFEIQPGAPLPVAPPSRPALPPVQPPPTLPNTPAPIPADPRVPQPVLPPAAADPTPRADSLALRLLDRDDPVRVGQPIRYSLSVSNQSNLVDSEVGIRFQLPQGVELSRVVQRLVPSANQFRRENGVVYLEPIRDLRPGETIDFDIELVSNQPQQIELMVEAVSRLMSGGTFATQSTRVLP